MDIECYLDHLNANVNLSHFGKLLCVPAPKSSAPSHSVSLQLCGSIIPLADEAEKTRAEAAETAELRRMSMLYQGPGQHRDAVGFTRIRLGLFFCALCVKSWMPSQRENPPSCSDRRVIVNE